MWSYVGKKTNPRWLWHAIDRRTGQVLAYVFGRRKDEVFLQLKKLLQPFGIKRFCTDGWGAYQRHLPAQRHKVDKRKTQRLSANIFSLELESSDLPVRLFVSLNLRRCMI
jgi:insertion element IS1 protein InsB